MALTPGDTKVENGRTYKFNENHRWERAGRNPTEETPPAKSKSSPAVKPPVMREYFVTKNLTVARILAEQTFGELGDIRSGYITKNDISVVRDKLKSKFKSDTEFAATMIGATPFDQDSYSNQFASVIDSMSDAAVKHAYLNLQTMEVNGSLDEVWQSLPLKSRLAIIDEGGRSGSVGGYYNARSGTLVVDGGWEDVEASEIYSHEIAHAIDGPGRIFSKTEEWTDAWAEEILEYETHEEFDWRLSEYATTSQTEGFCEYHRLFVKDPEKAKSDFPKCWDFLEKRGLVK